MYFFFREGLAGSIPFSYGIFSLLSILYFARTRQYAFFRFSQLLLILLLPFLLMVTLGGFINGSAVVLWALICPLGALLFDNPRHSLRWFWAFVGLVILSGFLQPYVRLTNHLSQSVVIFFFVINLLGVSSLVFLMVSYFVGQKNRFQEKSESLLLNILPKEIAAILKNESRTIGDSYMVAAGVPRGRSDHAQALVRMALEMRDYVATHTFGHSQYLSFRIGVNSGSMIAGVIGRRKFVYDVWGDAVNIASRMESHGLGNAVQITQTTYELIKDEFVCEPRGMVNVKGKGEMEAWLVTALKEKH